MLNYMSHVAIHISAIQITIHFREYRQINNTRTIYTNLLQEHQNTLLVFVYNYNSIFVMDCIPYYITTSCFLKLPHVVQITHAINYLMSQN